VPSKVYFFSCVDATAVSKFNAIIASGSFIGTGEDFEFNWGTSNANPDSRHPAYVDNYTLQELK
jgi:hypothetical protein